MTVEKMKVILNLDQIAVEIEADPSNEKEILKLAEAAVLEQLKKKFPRYSYATASVNALTMDTAKQGTVVAVPMKGKKTKETGIITGKNQKTIDVALSGGRILQGPPSAFEMKKVKNVEDIIWGRQPMSKNLNSWEEGDTGYINNGKELVPVVIGKSKGKKTKAFIINGEGRHYTLEARQLGALSETK